MCAVLHLQAKRSIEELKERYYNVAKIGAEDAAEDAELSAAVLAEVKRVGEVGRTVLHQELLDILAFCRA